MMNTEVTLLASIRRTSLESGGHARKLRYTLITDFSGKTVAEFIDNLLPGFCLIEDRRMSGNPHAFLEDRLLNPKGTWQKYNTNGNDDLDALLLLFETAWDHLLGAHKHTKWLGINCQQHPIDAMVIQELIFRRRPRVIIETGTHNGGGALFFASMLELAGVEGGKVITIDVNHPSVHNAKNLDGADPTALGLWKRRVQFVKGESTSKDVIAEVKEAVDAAMAAAGQPPGDKDTGGVMVLLDSDHKRQVVLEELEVYADMVSVGQYIVVEDTRLDRWMYTAYDANTGRGGGPAKAIEEFLGSGSRGGEMFERDRKVELGFSQHPGGYLLRVK